MRSATIKHVLTAPVRMLVQFTTTVILTALLAVLLIASKMKPTVNDRPDREDL